MRSVSHRAGWVAIALWLAVSPLAGAATGGVSKKSVARPTRTEVHPAGKLEPIVIRPNRAPEPEPPIAFELTQRSPGKLLLAFRAQDPKQELNTRATLIIQIYADEPVEVSPDLITEREWPKGAAQMELAVRGAAPGKKIQGEAAFTVCHSGTRVCRKMESPFELKLAR